MYKDFIPMPGYALCEIIQKPETTRSGIYLGSTTNDVIQHAKLIAYFLTEANKNDEYACHFKSDVILVFRNYSYIKFDDTCGVVKIDDILGVL